MNNVLKEDIERVVNSDLPWYALANQTILITGATGLIGSNLLRILSMVSKSRDLNMRLIGYTRQKYGDICSPVSIKDKVDYIFHCAAMTSSADMVAKPTQVITTAFEGTKNILEFALKQQCKGVVYLSSMEVYGTMDKPEVYETDLGYLDLSNPRSSYPESKRLCESLCVAYCKQYDLPVKIARLARTFGAGVPNKSNDNRIAMQFARNVMSGKDIVLHTAGNSLANCVYTSDAIFALCTILLKGQYGHAYNISGDTATVLQMATMVAKEFGVNVIFDIPENKDRLGYAPTVLHRLNTDKIRALGWQPSYNILDMYKRMIDDWREYSCDQN